MQITLDFQEGTPDVPRGRMQYFFVRSRSKHDGKIRMFGAWYLNSYGLVYNDGPCPQCPYPDGEKDCHGADTGECPTTGWFDEKTDPEFDTAYYRMDGEVLGFAPQPEPTT